jgi:hypothetical protein
MSTSEKNKFRKRDSLREKNLALEIPDYRKTIKQEKLLIQSQEPKNMISSGMVNKSYV